MPRPRRLTLTVLGLTLALALLAAVPAGAGEWSVGREAGVAWFRAPDGTRFYSKGVNIVCGFKATDTTHNGTSLAGGPGFFWGNHYPDRDSWRREASRRLPAWGFNTRGGWSDPSPEFGLALAPDLELGRTARLHWFDPLAPGVPDRVAAAARELMAPHAGDDLLMGVFTDNEAGWWSSQLFRWYLSRPPDNHTKQRLLDLLRTWYDGSWERLAADFVPAGISGFAGLEAAGAELKLRPGGRGIAVVNAFTRLLAAAYYRLVRDAVLAARPGALLLGDRLPLYFNQDAVLGMRDSVDAISTNYNVDTADGWVAPWFFEALEALGGGRPVLVSEWFCAARENRSGNLNNGHLLTVPGQADRVRAAETALRNFAAFPNVAGTHWFQLYDEPLGGRADGEDYNFGLVDRFDAPYEDLTAMFARVNPELDALHAAARFDDPTPTRAVRRAAALRLDDASVTDWDKRPTRLRGWAVLEPYQPFGDVHLAWSEAGLHLMHLAQNHLEPPFLDYAGEFPLSEAYRLFLSLDAGRGERRFCIALSPANSTQWANVWEITPRAYALDGDRAEPAPDLAVAQLAKPLPHIALEAFVPAAALGLPALRAGQSLRLGLDVRGFFRERRMTFPGPARDPFGPDGPIPTTSLLLED
ncbi:MAG: hypothetical protein AB1916_06135 [Thermodesulfobacteriota bacterium]